MRQCIAKLFCEVIIPSEIATRTQISEYICECVWMCMQYIQCKYTHTLSHTQINGCTFHSLSISILSFKIARRNSLKQLLVLCTCCALNKFGILLVINARDIALTFGTCLKIRSMLQLLQPMTVAKSFVTRGYILTHSEACHKLFSRACKPSLHFSHACFPHYLHRR